MIPYRSPQAFVQFIGETLFNVSPKHILSVRTAKSLGSPAGTFELTFKTSDEPDGSDTNGWRSQLTGQSKDWWFDQIQPMTMAVIALSDGHDIAQVQSVLSNEDRLRQSPAEFLSGQAPEQQRLIRRSVVMVGLVEEVTISAAMTSAGMQRVLRVTGRDFGSIMVDDSLRRIARSTTDRTDASRLITMGTIPQDDLNRLLLRSSISEKNNYWQKASASGYEGKIKLSEAVESILLNAPSHGLRLKNGRALRDYFRRVSISEELESMYVRGWLMLFTYNGPVWEAITQLAPIPLAEVFVDTDGLENVLYVRRPPFYRYPTMQYMQESMLSFIRTSSPSATVSLDDLLDPNAFSQDDFISVPSRIESGVTSGYHVAGSEDVISLSLSRGSRIMFSQYQVVPAVMLRGRDVDQAVYQGAIASYLYDLPAALRYGSRFLQAVCPWDVTASPADDADASNVRSTTGNTEMALSATEAVRLYYYMRDLPALRNGSVVLRGRPEIRVGDRINLPDDDDLLLYVESVQHTYQYGSPFVTQLSVSRGQPRLPTARLMDYDQDPPAINLAQIPEDANQEAQ